MRELFEDEHEAFRASFAAFLDREVAPGTSPADVYARAGRHGFLGMQVPEEYGGGGVDDPRFGVVAVEELTRAGRIGLALAFATQVGVAIPLLLAHADAEQRARWLPRLVSGEHVAAVSGTAVRSAPMLGGVRLDGVLTGVVNGAAADLVVTPARSVSGEECVVVVDRAAAGMSAKPAELLGMHGAAIADLRLDAVDVAVRETLSAGAADRICLDQHLWTAVVALAGTRPALDWTLGYVKERKAFGRPVAAFENTHHALARVLTGITATECLVDTCVRERAAGRLTRARAAAAELAATELFGHAADEGLQLHGGYGYMREYPIAQAFADAGYFRLHGPEDRLTRVLAGELGLTG